MIGDYVLALAGPLAWFAAHVASYIVVPNAYEAKSAARLAIVDAPAFGIMLIALVATLAQLRHLPQDAPPRRKFVLHCALVLAAGSMLLLLGIALPPMLLPPGAEP